MSVMKPLTVLIATDGSEEIHSACRLLIALIRPEALEHVLVLTVTWPPHDAPLWDEALMRLVLVDDLHRAVAIVAAEAMEKIKREFTPTSVAVESMIGSGDAAQEILRVAKERDVDLIVIGRHPQSASEESVSQRVLAAARCPVLVGSPGAVGRDARSRRTRAEGDDLA